LSLGWQCSLRSEEKTVIRCFLNRLIQLELKYAALSLSNTEARAEEGREVAAEGSVEERESLENELEVTERIENVRAEESVRADEDVRANEDVTERVEGDDIV